MKRTPLLLLAAALALPAAAQGRRPVGAVTQLDVSAVTRDRITTWIRATLPDAPRGGSATFTGKLDVANVEVPFRSPARVLLQPAAKGAGSDAVFFVDVDLPKVPEALLSRAGAHAVDLTLDGALKGEKGDVVPVFAVGVLRFRTQQVNTPAGASVDFLRFAGARLTQVSLTQTSGEAKIVLYNPLSFVVPVREVRYELHAGGRRLAAGSKKAVRLRPRQEAVVTLPITAANVDLAAAAGSALLSKGVVDGRLLGAITVKVRSGDLTIPVDMATRVEVGK